MWQQIQGHIASLERFIPRGRVKMQCLQWQLKSHWSPAMDNPAAPIPCPRTACSVSGSEMDVWSPSPGASSVLFCSQMLDIWLGYTSAVPNHSRDMNRGEISFPYQYLGNKGSSFGFDCLQRIRSWESLWS